jgi:hypothetical protein
MLGRRLQDGSQRTALMPAKSELDDTAQALAQASRRVTEENTGFWFKT